MREIFKYKSVKVKRKLNNLDLKMSIVKLNECNIIKGTS